VIGTTLAHFRITAKLGEGGMGEVWRATDTRLGREVAVKVLPERFVAEPERLARFEREARLLAALSHPNVAAIHEVGAHGALHFLVMELAPGETLAERIARGPLPLAEALPIALQVAEALEAAHERGIVHRDLKPANVMVDGEGRVKVLDFGLARALEPEPGSAAAAQLAHSPTMTYQSTAAGLLLGTAAYMSPEQAAGRPADRRADIWAFGALLFEMLAGRPIFGGDSVSHLLAAVLRDEPAWTQLPRQLPPGLRRLLERCLRKEPRRRLQSMGDARVTLEDLLTDSGAQGTAASTAASPRSWRQALPWGLAGIAGALALGALLVRPGSTPAPPGREPSRLSVPGISVAGSGVAISPDGRVIAAYDTTPGAPRLLRRDLGSYDAQPIPGSEGGFNPFFSPNGGSLGFFSDRRLCVLALAGGERRCLAPAAGFATGSWGPEGTIVFSDAPSGDEPPGLRRVPAAGGAVEWLTRADRSAGERNHGYPQVLPDGRHVLFTVFGAERDHLAVVPLAGGAPRTVLPNALRGRYTRSGHLVYVDWARGGVHVVPFDAGRLEVAGASVELPLRGIAQTSDRVPSFELSDEGTLVYSFGNLTDDEFEVVLLDRQGSATVLVEQTGSWGQPRVSPDGRTVVVRRAQQPDCHLWEIDLVRRTLSRLTDTGDAHDPHWTADGVSIIFSAQGLSREERQVYVQRRGGDVPAAPLFLMPFHAVARSVSPDERLFAIVDDNRTGDNDIVIHDREGGETVAFAASGFDEEYPAFSPDGRFIAYTSDETGRPEVYVRPYPGPGGKYRVSTAGGTGAIWSRDGGELFYGEGTRLMRVAVEAPPGATGFTAEVPEALFDLPALVWERVRNYDVMPDGQRFVAVRRRGGVEAPRELRVVLGWFAELERLAPARRRR
jgi:eukaryotic-like serine/threonine-protein kinase